MSFFSSLKNYTRGHPGSNQGPLGLQPNALPLSYISAAYRFNNITANTCRLFEHCYNVFCFDSSVLSSSMPFSSSLSKIIQGDTLCSDQGSLGLQPNALPRAISPQHTDSKISLQTRSGCLSTVTMFFFPVKCTLAIDVIFLLSQKLYKGTPGFEPGTSRTAAECSTTELYPRCIQIQ